ncbi:MAG: cyclase family protein [Clostridiales bacterium]|nr:cyclase family protein [Clostridiales bacterium]
MNVRIIDLSMDIYHEAPTFAYDPKCAVIVHNTVESIGYNITQISMSSHQGTHLDAPFHFINDGTTVDELPLESFAGKAFLVDMRHKKPHEPLNIDDFLPYENRISKGTRLIYQTGWDKKFPDKSYFSEFPYLTKELADWFAGKGIMMLGMDTPTPNPVDWKYVHHALLGKGIVIVEGLANLNKITADEFLFVAAPLRLKGRDGSPVRALAFENIF